MRVHPALITWLLRPTWRVTLTALPLALAYVLLRREPFVYRDLDDFYTWVFIAFHAALVAMPIMRANTSDAAFLLSRGFARDLLWTHRILAGLLAIAVVWLPVALCFWLPIRSGIQDALFESPYYPVFGPFEGQRVWGWLAAYLTTFAVFQYMWVRSAQPARRRDAGAFLTAGFLASAFTALIFASPRRPAYVCVAVTAGLALVILLLAAGRLLHRRVEVQL